MNFTSVDIHLFANYLSASSFTSCLHTEETALVSGGLFILQLQAYLLSWNSLHFMKAQPKSMTCVNQFHFLHTKFWSDLTLVWDILPFSLGFFLYIKRTQTKPQTSNKKTLKKPRTDKLNQTKSNQTSKKP